MKPFLFVAFFTVSTVLSFSSSAQVSNTDTLVHRVFASLKTKDDQAYLKLFPNYKQVASLMRMAFDKLKNTEIAQKMAGENLNMDSLIDAELAKFTEERYKEEMQKSVLVSFQSFIKKGEDKGVNWNNVVLTSYKLDTIKDPIMGMTTLKGVMDFRDSSKEYQLAFKDALLMEAEGGWYGTMLSNVVRKGEPLVEDKPEFDDFDIEKVDVDTSVSFPDEPAEPKKSVKKVTPKKTSGNTPKKGAPAKTKSPARKPKG